jgi:hypothetical protein
MKRPIRENAQDPPDDSGESVGIAAKVRTRRDIVWPRGGYAVQPWVEETEWGLVVRNKVVIQQRDNTRHSLYICGQLGAEGKGKMYRRRAARAPEKFRLPVVSNHETARLRRDVRNAAA